MGLAANKMLKARVEVYYLNPLLPVQESIYNPGMLYQYKCLQHPRVKQVKRIATLSLSVINVEWHHIPMGNQIL